MIHVAVVRGPWPPWPPWPWPFGPCTASPCPSSRSTSARRTIAGLLLLPQHAGRKGGIAWKKWIKKYIWFSWFGRFGPLRAVAGLSGPGFMRKERQSVLWPFYLHDSSIKKAKTMRSKNFWFLALSGGSFLGPKWPEIHVSEPGIGVCVRNRADWRVQVSRRSLLRSIRGHFFVFLIFLRKKCINKYEIKNNET